MEAVSLGKIVDRLMVNFDLSKTLPEDVEFFKRVKAGVEAKEANQSYICWEVVSQLGDKYTDYKKRVLDNKCEPIRQVMLIATALCKYEAQEDTAEVDEHMSIASVADVDDYANFSATSWSEGLKRVRLAWLSKIVEALEEHYGHQNS